MFDYKKTFKFLKYILAFLVIINLFFLILDLFKIYTLSEILNKDYKINSISISTNSEYYLVEDKDKIRKVYDSLDKLKLRKHMRFFNFNNNNTDNSSISFNSIRIDTIDNNKNEINYDLLIDDNINDNNNYNIHISYNRRYKIIDEKYEIISEFYNDNYLQNIIDKFILDKVK